MRKHTGFLIGSLLISLSAGTALAVEPVRIAQDSGPSLQKQRAPGVPLSPSPVVVEQRESGRVGDSMVPMRSRNVRQAINGSQIERDPPMPRGVPSIIAP